jgi:hypothetical protein
MGNINNKLRMYNRHERNSREERQLERSRNLLQANMKMDFGEI